MFALLIQLAFATTTNGENFTALAARADAAVRVEVLAQSARCVGGRIVTDSKVRVTGAEFGAAVGDELTVTTLGGTIGSLGQTAFATKAFGAGDHLALLLSPTGFMGGGRSVVGAAAGMAHDDPSLSFAALFGASAANESLSRDNVSRSVVCTGQPALCVQAPYGVPPAQTPFYCTRAVTSGTDNKPISGPSLNWPGRAASFFTSTVTTDVAASDAIAAIQASTATWVAVPGGQFTYTYAGATTSTQIGYDFLHTSENQNIVIFQTQWTYDASIIGLTTVTFDSTTGEIFDADVELNNQDYSFTTSDTVVQTDIQNTVTHELGHFVGFAHTDEDWSTLPSDCALTATMARKTQLGELCKRNLAASDMLGFTFVYPAGVSANGFCWPGTPDAVPPPTISQTGAGLGGCSSIRFDLLPLLFLVAILRLWLFMRQRKKRGPPPPLSVRKYRWNKPDETAVKKSDEENHE